MAAQKTIPKQIEELWQLLQRAIALRDVELTMEHIAALGRLARVSPECLRFLEDQVRLATEPDVGNAALLALGHAGDKAPRDFMLRLLSTAQDERVRLIALSALCASYCDPRSAAATKFWVAGNQWLPVFVHPVPDPKARQDVLSALCFDASPLVKSAAARVLSFSFQDDPQMVAQLSQLLSSCPDAVTRRFCAIALREADSPEAVSALKQALCNDSDVEVRKNAALAMATKKNCRDDAFLLASFDSQQHSAVKYMIAYALAQSTDPSVEPFMRWFLESATQATEARMEAIRCLGRRPNRNSAELLLRLAADSSENTDVRIACVSNLHLWSATLEQSGDSRPCALMSGILADSAQDVRLRQAAARGIALTENAEAPEALIRVVECETSEEVRAAAIEALVECAPPEFSERLQRIAGATTSPELREMIVEAIRQMEKNE